MNTTQKILTPAILLATLALSAPGEEHRNRPSGINDPAPQSPANQVQGRLGGINDPAQPANRLEADPRDRSRYGGANDPAHRTDAGQFHGSQPLGTLTRVSDVVGLDVQNYQDEKLGKVEDIVFDVGAGRIVGFIVSSGGVLGVGVRQVTVPPSAVHYDEGKRVLHMNATKESFEKAPPFEAARWEEFRRQPAGVAQVYQYYGVTPYFTNAPGNADNRLLNRTEPQDDSTLRSSEPGSPAPDADNSALNRRDREGGTLTPLDQGGSKDEADVTARIRQAVMDREGLSVTAQNVKIVTAEGLVTLRGPVNSEEERRLIGEIAAAAYPSGRVDNQLEVKRP